MTKSSRNPKVDAYFARTEKWHEELQMLRKIVLRSKLAEELKWGKPCYTSDGKAVILLHGLKETCALAFFKGALMKDAKHVLLEPGPNSQSGRWIKFTSMREIAAMEPTLKTYINEAIAVEKAGLRVTRIKAKDMTLPAELQNKFDKMPSFKKAFYALTPGRQRAYIIYFSAATQSATRELRIEKHTQRILNGIGFNDR